MEYSLQRYLEQRSTEELNMILNYLVNNYMHKPDDGVRMILAILQEREKDMPVTIPQELVLWAKNLGEVYLRKNRKKPDTQD